VWLEGGEEEREGARLCWQEREREVLTTLVNTSITAADFETALKVKEQCKEGFSPPSSTPASLQQTLRQR
jgi:hypothetical protein